MQGQKKELIGSPGTACYENLCVDTEPRDLPTLIDCAIKSNVPQNVVHNTIQFSITVLFKQRYESLHGEQYEQFRRPTTHIQ